jgi:hypothetical protein
MSQRLRLVVALLHPQDENRFTLMYAPISKDPDYALKDNDRYKYQLIDYKYDSYKDVLLTEVKTLVGNQVNIYPVNSRVQSFPMPIVVIAELLFGTVCQNRMCRHIS